MIKTLDRLLDHLTMYRLVLYYLAALLIAAFLFGFLKLVPHDPTALAFTTALVLATCWITNKAFARIFGVPANSESVYITALILALILDPIAPTDAKAIGAVAFASVWAISSKYILAVGRKHLFNPAALGVALTALLLDHPATWWVGSNIWLFPLVLVGGALVVRKLRRLDLVATFLGAALATIMATTDPSEYGAALAETFSSSPLLFFAFVMLTEPLTAPTTRWPRIAFAALVGFLFAPNIHVGSFYFTPELALLAGNLFAYAVSPKGRFVLTLERIEQTAVDSYDFIFRSQRKLAFQAGQYLEWTLGLDRSDNRGNRRYFTLASSPTEQSVRLGVKFYPQSSAFKQALGGMKPGATIHASQLAGDFTLPSDPNTKIAFLAGGIGITPFRSMLQYLIDRNEARPVVVLYGTERQDDIAYRDVLDTARRKLGVRVFHAVAKGAVRGQYPGYIDARLVRLTMPDYLERTFYVSGPQSMVKAVRKTLLAMGVRRSKIKVDYFPGFA
ncbi:RnfABCDGE type electron transport complex subunit D [Mesorhizobium sp. WSM4976]|uniref:RnfABCDGE type electron transport complex subunit D n=1 Tax=Mesorhizobium sp. WSM4976 TaxID=3038549 RepID=UPI002415A974|nr:RnfABCDGE type electron transport complex subunit D [Mesorhizobium sp. WSM4976]MDG4892238.1 RnfABCDGE type electron transport complex subunit D [Mesorhizobium sp. WSM4976]